VLLHVLTEKGRGHPGASTHPERVHGVKGTAPAKTAGAESSKVPGPVGAPAPKPQGPSFTKAFADSLAKIAERDVRVHALTAGMPSGTGLEGFAERFPSRFHDTGITEQHAVAMAAGMAKAGLRPVAAIYSTFLQRAYDQVFQEVALQNLPVVFAMDRAGLVGQDGPTHNGVFDIAYLRTLPNMTLCAPRDATDMRRMLELAIRLTGPCALRYPRDNAPGIERIHGSERAAMQPGKAEVLVEHERERNVAIWVYGSIVDQALEAAERLQRRDLPVTVVDARFAKPLDEELLAQHLGAYRWIVTLEEHQRAGGFGSAVLECACRLPNARAQVKVLGVPDRFVEHRTTREEQLAGAGLDADAVERFVRNLLLPTLVG
jgi:1-deoxy-D-xylulose-5-phosphate synthase